jgi:hypothetical protein
MKAVVKRVVNAVVASVTSPEAVTAEKSIVVLVVVRVALALGASAGLVETVQRIFS